MCDLKINIQPGRSYRFTKSGNVVKTIEATTYGGPGHWVVARVDTGKEMVVHEKALISTEDPRWS